MQNFEFIKLEINDEINKDELIEKNKQVSKMKKTAQANAKLNKCYYCEKENIQYCNSHSIPKFALKNISSNGELLHINTLLKLPFEKNKKGIDEAGTFKLICRDCDSYIFKDYENPENYLNNPTPKMLAEISLKNYLKSISKRLIEIEIYNQCQLYTQDPTLIDVIKRKEINSKMDLNEYEKSYKKAKRIAIKNWDDEYYTIFFKKLDYIVPIAFQSNIALVCDIEGNIINDIYNNDENYRIQDIQLCIFPLENSSIILLFMDSQNRRYRKFNKQFKSLSDEEKLKILNYIIFLYSEDIFFSKEIKEVIENSKELIETSKYTANMLCYNDSCNYIEAAKEQFSLKKIPLIPNFLSEKFALNLKD